MVGSTHLPMTVKYVHLLYRLTFLLTTVAIMARSNEVDDKMKQMVEQSGCPFVNIRQILVRNVCLMPGYQANEMPNNLEGETVVNIDLHRPSVLEVDEKKNKITIKVSQRMTWWEPRIRANFSALTDETKIIWLSPKIANIWHPDLDMYTEGLQEWKSLHDPYLFKRMAVHRSHKIEGVEQESNQTVTKLDAKKEWKATFVCMFDFSSFPLDTQHCAFLQKGILENMIFKLNPLERHGTKLSPLEKDEYWKQEADGFKVTMQPISSVVATDGIGFHITLERIVQPYLYQYYFPCIAIVVVSLISFIIPLSAIPGRVALVVTQFLTLTNIFIHQMVRRASRNYII